MSPQQREQFHARLAKVAAERAIEAAAAKPEPAAPKTVTNTKSSAARVAKHKAKNPDAVRARNAATKRAARAAAKKA